MQLIRDEDEKVNSYIRVESIIAVELIWAETVRMRRIQIDCDPGWSLDGPGWSADDPGWSESWIIPLTLILLIFQKQPWLVICVIPTFFTTHKEAGIGGLEIIKRLNAGQMALNLQSLVCKIYFCELNWAKASWSFCFRLRAGNVMATHLCDWNKCSVVRKCKSHGQTNCNTCDSSEFKPKMVHYDDNNYVVNTRQSGYNPAPL